MHNITDIKAHIKSVNETRQITKAMELISVSKLKKAQERYDNNIRYFKRLVAAVNDILARSPEIENKYLKKRDGDRCAFVVISGDKGLAGGYNHNVLSFAKEKITECKEHHLITIGRTAVDFFSRNGMEIDLEYLYVGHNPTLKIAREITYDLLRLYDDGIIDRTEIIFTDIEGETQRPVSLQVLPLSMTERYGGIDAHEPLKPAGEILFDPNPEEVLHELVVQYLVGLIYTVLLRCMLSENKSRMAAMGNATRNADEILDDLRLQYNRARQESITNELLEIVSGSLK